MTERRIYRNPPVVRAICAVDFDECEDWSLKTTGEIWSELQGTYPKKPTMNLSAQLDTVIGPDGSQAIAFRGTDPITSLADESRFREFSYGPKTFSFTSNQPYEGWEKFRARIVQGTEAFLGFATPGLYRRMGVRYINKIEFDFPEVDLDRYFVSAPDVPQTLGLTLQGFNSRIEAGWTDEATTIVTTFQSAASDSGRPTITLDIDVIEAWPHGEKVPDVVERFSRLREIERSVFEASITDQTRRLFDGD